MTKESELLALADRFEQVKMSLYMDDVCAIDLPTYHERDLIVEALRAATKPTPYAGLVEQFNILRGLIRECKSVEGGFITNNLDAAETHLDNIEAALLSTRTGHEAIK